MLSGRPDDDALRQIGLGLNRGVVSGDFGEAVFWLLVFAHWRGTGPSDEIRALLRAFLAEA